MKPGRFVKKIFSVSAALASLIALGGCSTLTGLTDLPGKADKPVIGKAVANESSGNRQGRRQFKRSVYASTGLGASRLEPDNSQIPTWNVSDKVNAGGQITLGADVNRHFSVELHSADLGSAGVEKFGGSLRGRINYHMHGGSVLWYAGKNRHRSKRNGLTGYGRAGVALMDNSPVGNAPYSQRNSTQMLVGAGLEYATQLGVGLRAEVISFDADAQYAQLGLIYRLGRQPQQKQREIFHARRENAVAPVPGIAAARVTPKDGDNDGVADASDKCPATKAGATVTSEGCAVFDGALAGVNFYSTSARLTFEAKRVLNEVADVLAEYPHVRISVQAHTDSVGSTAYNQDLSQRRARTVVRYLGQHGIDTELLVPTAFGESQPIANNNTVEGRARNRRVELEPLQNLEHAAD